MNRQREDGRRQRQIERGALSRPNRGVELRAIDRSRVVRHAPRPVGTARAGDTTKPAPRPSSRSTPVPHATARSSGTTWKARHARTHVGPPTNRRRLNFYGHFNYGTRKRPSRLRPRRFKAPR